jgi:hypothetical protein
VEKEPGVKVWRERFLYRTPDEKDSRPIVEKGSDVRVALLMYEGAVRDRYDVAVLVASDADFGPAVEMVRALGKRVVWAHAPKHKGMKALTRKGAEPFEMTIEMLERCRYVPQTPVGSTKGIAGRVQGSDARLQIHRPGEPTLSGAFPSRRRCPGGCVALKRAATRGGEDVASWRGIAPAPAAADAGSPHAAP